MKRPILGFLAALLMGAGLLGSPPARAATSSNVSTAIVAPAHDSGPDHDDGGGYMYSHPQGHGSMHRNHPRHGYGDDDHGYDHDGRGRRRRCDGLIVVCLL